MATAVLPASSGIDVLIADKESTKEVVTCLVCFDDFEAGASEGWLCAHGHPVCTSCLQTYIECNLKDVWAQPLRCPGQCTEALTRDDLTAAGVDAAAQKGFDRYLAKVHNPDLVDCPSCAGLVDSKLNRPNLHCDTCATDFCFHHSLGHAGQPCGHGSEGVVSAVANKVWLMRNTRRCPTCKNAIQKNGGCNHMTCRCGFEMCWQCGKNYSKHGRRGHGRKLFPRPGELKYQCNDAKLWLQRVGIVALAIPAGVTAAGVLVPAFVVFRGGKLLLNTSRRVTHWLSKPARTARLAREQRNRSAMYGMQHCQQFHENAGNTTTCLTCAGRTTCSHSRGIVNNMCVECHHFVPQVHGCIAHYYSPGSDMCFFCNQPSAEAAASSAATAALSATQTDPLATASHVTLPESQLDAIRQTLLEGTDVTFARVARLQSASSSSTASSWSAHSSASASSSASEATVGTASPSAADASKAAAASGINHPRMSAEGWAQWQALLREIRATRQLDTQSLQSAAENERVPSPAEETAVAVTVMEDAALSTKRSPLFSLFSQQQQQAMLKAIRAKQQKQEILKAIRAIPRPLAGSEPASVGNTVTLPAAGGPKNDHRRRR